MFTTKVYFYNIITQVLCSNINLFILLFPSHDQGALLRYSDLASAEDKANLRAALDAIEGPLKEELKAWRQENEDASPEAFKTFLLTTMDTLISALPSEISGGITPRAITGKLVDSRLGIDPVSNSEVGEGNKRIEFTSQGKRKDEQ